MREDVRPVPKSGCRAEDYIGEEEEEKKKKPNRRFIIL